MIRRHFTRAALALAVLGLAPIGAAQAQDCGTESTMKSVQAGGPAELSFRNASTQSRRLYWLDPTGDRKFIAIVQPGTIFKQATTAGHAWIVTDDAEKCVNAIAVLESATVDVGGPQTAVVTPPTPGVAQPIAPVPVLPPVAGQSAPMAAPAPVAPPVMAQPVPVTPPVMAPVMAQPEPQPQAVAAVALPQVSPVEQFDLRGPYRFVPRVDETKLLNNQASGNIEVARVKPDWDSGKWQFEEVRGTPFVRIKNQWKNTVLTDVEGKLRATNAPPQAEESHWSFEPVDGTSYVQLRNRESDRFLLVVNGAPVLVDDFRQDQE